MRVTIFAYRMVKVLPQKKKKYYHITSSSPLWVQADLCPTISSCVLDCTFTYKSFWCLFRSSKTVPRFLNTSVQPRNTGISQESEQGTPFPGRGKKWGKPGRDLEKKQNLASSGTVQRDEMI